MMGDTSNGAPIRAAAPKRGVAWLVLGIGLGASLLLWKGFQEQNEESARLQFDLHVREIVGAIEARLRQHEQILLGGAGLFDTSHPITRADWRAYVERLNLKTNYPGILGVGFSALIPPDALEAHIASIRAEGFPEYTVKPPGKRDLYTAIIYLEPFSGRNLAAFGFDMYSEPTRNHAMRLAVDSGRTSISGKVKLVQETHGKVQAGFLMYVPVYRDRIIPPTAEARWQALRGFVYSPYRIGDLMHGILGERELHTDFAIYDGDKVGDDLRMYDSSEEHADEGDAPPRFKADRQINAYGHTWLISLSLFALTWILIGRREHALSEVDKATQQLRVNEIQLKASEERFRRLFSQSAIGITLNDFNTGQYLEVNDALLAPSGYTREEFLKLSYWDVTPREYEPIEMAQLESLRTTRRYGPFEKEYLRKDGSRYPVRLQGFTMTETNGEKVIWSIVEDISVQKAAEADMAAALSLLHDVLAAASEVSIIATDPQGLITVFNPGAERMLGYSAEEMVGKQSPAIIHLASEVVARGEELTAALGKPVSGFRAFVEIAEQAGHEQREWNYVRKNGSQFTVSLVVTAMRDTAGHITGYLGIAQDITERKQAEQALQDQARHTQSILNHIFDVIITIDANGIILSCNLATEQTFGYAADELIGQNVKILMPEPHRSAHDSYLRRYHATGNGRIIDRRREVDAQRKDGTLFPVELAVTEITQGAKKMYIGVIRDITERKRIDRMQNEFVSTVSHELRTPLTSISGALGLLSGGMMGNLPDPVKQLLEIASKNSLRLTHLINDLLDMEKIAAGKLSFNMKVHDLMPLIDQAIEANKSYAEQHNVRLVCTRRAEGVQTVVDDQRLLQVLSNFISNAAKFSPAGEQVDITIDGEPELVRVAVTDHGPGIPSAFHDRIFQKFSQADASDTRQKGGTGLGLAISKELVERMGGYIGFRSEEGQGATFFFELPRFHAQSHHSLGSQRGLLKSHPHRILIVEDDPDTARLLALMLEQAGYACDVALTGTQAIAYLGSGQYAAMTLDLGLPDMRGTDVIHYARSRPQSINLPIVVVSGHVESGQLALALDFPDIDWMSKPIDSPRLLKMIKQGLSEERPGPTRILHVEDDTNLAQVVRAMAGSHFQFDHATRLSEARAMLSTRNYDVILLDIHLPDGSGWDLLGDLQMRTPRPRVIVLSGSDVDAEDLARIESVLPKSQITQQVLLDTLNSRISASHR